VNPSRSTPTSASRTSASHMLSVGVQLVQPPRESVLSGKPPRVVVRVEPRAALAAILSIVAAKLDIELAQLLSVRDSNSALFSPSVSVEGTQVPLSDLESTTMEVLGFSNEQSVVVSLKYDAAGVAAEKKADSPQPQASSDEEGKQSKARDDAAALNIVPKSRELPVATLGADGKSDESWLLTHEVRVTRPAAGSQAQVAAQDEPEEFFEFKRDDLLVMLRKPALDGVLATKQMRDAAKQSAAVQSADFTRLRICFPGQYVIQAQFKSSATIQHLYEFVQRCVREEWTAISLTGAQKRGAPAPAKRGATEKEFHLYITPPVRRLDRAARTLKQEELVPSAVIYFGIHALESVLPSPDEILCSEVLAIAQERTLPKQQPPRQNGREQDERDSALLPPAPLESSTQAPQTIDDGSSAAAHGGAGTKKKMVPKWFKR